MRKSLISALYGIAIDRGLIDKNSTLEDLGADDQNPPLSPQEKQARVVHLLQSRSGIYHDSVRDDSGDQRPAQGSHSPGTAFYYNNWSFNALGTILEEATGLTMGEAFKQWIADPIGMQDFRVEDVAYEYSSGSVYPAYRFWITARDLARFGVLYSQEGKWNGQEIIPSQWIRESTRSYSDAGLFGYGYMWWVSRGSPDWLGRGSYLASGTGGQKVLVDPEQELVIVHRVDTGRLATRALWTEYGPRVNNNQFLELARQIVAASPDEN